MNKPINFELAKLLKEKGFDKNGYLQDVWLGNKYEGKYPKLKEIPVFGLGSTSVLPTIAEVIMWLYEKHEVWINVTSDYNRFNTWQYRITSKNRTIGKDGIIYNEGLNSPTEAYSSAIEYTLKNLIKEN